MADFLFVDNRINRSSIQSIIQIGQASELYFQRLHTNCTRVDKAIKRKPHGYGFQPIPTRFFCGASGDTAFFKKHSNINGFRTPEQRNYLYSALLKPSISAAIARFISR
ncbi:MAG: hypothetical protein ACLU3D_07630 [Acutalibacteraceae bacterium]